MCFTFLLLLIFSTAAECQNGNSSDLTQEVLFYSLKSETVKKEFRICDFECNRIDVFDLNNMIREHPFDFEVCEKKINLYNTTSIDHPSPNSIVIYRLDKIGDSVLKIYLLRPFSGASVILTYSIIDGIKLIDTRVGTF